MKTMLADIASEIPNSMDLVYSFISDGGVFMLCLILLSIVSVTVIVLKGLTLRVSKIQTHTLMKMIFQV